MPRFPNADKLFHRSYLVFPDLQGKCVRKPFVISRISHELVLRGSEQDCAQNPNEICTLHPELVLRDVPGKSAQRWR